MNSFKFNSFNGSSQQGFSSSAKAKPPAIPTFQLDAQADFPELMQSTTLPSTTTTTTNSYMKAIRTNNNANSAADPNDDVPNGWVKYTYNHNTKTMSVFDSTLSRNIQRFNKKGIKEDEDKDFFLFTKLINKLEDNRNRYADNYIEIYGQDYYDHFHLMPNYQLYPDSDAMSDVGSDYDSTSSIGP